MQTQIQSQGGTESLLIEMGFIFKNPSSLQTQENKKIIKDGLEALISINKICYAVSTKKRFIQFAKINGLELIERDFNKKDLQEGFFLINNEKYRKFELVKEFKQTGYGAWHIGSKIEELQEKGENPLIINGKRNRRFLLKEIK